MSIHQLPGQKKTLSLFLETESLNKYILTNEQELTRILGYSGCEHFKFIRSTDSFNSNIIDNINQFVIFSVENDHVQIGDKNINPSQYKHVHFVPEMAAVEEFADKTYDKERLNSNELNSILVLFIHRAFILYRIYQKNAFAFVTQNRRLLENREWLEKKLGKLNIMTVQESIRYMDLYAKHESKYYVEPYHLVNKDLWYWDSFRTKIPHYHVPHRENMESVHILEGFASRFKFLLLAIDEIGIQLYFPKDRDIMVPYHFNYFLSLATGIFDNLAIETKSKYNISFDRDNIQSKTSLSSKSGKDFLNALKNKNPNLREHLDRYGKFIELIHKMRDISIHREGFRDMAYHDSTGISFFLEIKKQERVHALIRDCGDMPSNYDKFTNWGIFDDEFFIFLEPYRFVIAAATQLISFCDRYLELMGFRNFLESLPRDRSEFELFGESRLGF